MPQPATAGITVAAIFMGLAALYFGYRGYVKWYRYYHKPVDNELPPIRQPIASYTASNMQPSTSIYAETWRTVGSGSRASLQGAAGSIYGRLSPEFGQVSCRHSMAGLPACNSPDSTPASPFAGPADITPPAGAAASPTSADTTASYRMSSASTMTLKRTYAGSVYKGSSTMSVTTPLSPSQRRDSYLPHSPYNRDSIQIVPPQPLGVGLGGMALATDERTLAFSKSSGIGSGEDNFAAGLLWSSGTTTPERSLSTAPDSTLSPTHSATSSQTWSPSMGRDQLNRYLQEGPVRGHSSRVASVSDSSPRSRPRSLASGSVALATAEPHSSRQGDAMSAEATSSEVSSQFHGGPSFTSRQSPLHALTLKHHGGDIQANNPPPATSRLEPSSAGIDQTRSQRQESPLSQAADTTANSSPILGAFRGQQDQSQQQQQHSHYKSDPLSERELSNSCGSLRNESSGPISRSGSGTTDSTSNDSPSTPVDTNDHEGEMGRGMALGKDGTLVVNGKPHSQPNFVSES